MTQRQWFQRFLTTQCMPRWLNCQCCSYRQGRSSKSSFCLTSLMSDQLVWSKRLEIWKLLRSFLRAQTKCGIGSAPLHAARLQVWTHKPSNCIKLENQRRIHHQRQITFRTLYGRDYANRWSFGALHILFADNPHFKTTVFTLLQILTLNFEQAWFGHISEGEKKKCYMNVGHKGTDPWFAPWVGGSFRVWYISSQIIPVSRTREEESPKNITCRILYRVRHVEEVESSTFRFQYTS